MELKELSNYLSTELLKQPLILTLFLIGIIGIIITIIKKLKKGKRKNK